MKYGGWCSNGTPKNQMPIVEPIPDVSDISDSSTQGSISLFVKSNYIYSMKYGGWCTNGPLKNRMAIVELIPDVPGVIKIMSCDTSNRCDSIKHAQLPQRCT